MADKITGFCYRLADTDWPNDVQVECYKDCVTIWSKGSDVHEGTLMTRDEVVDLVVLLTEWLKEAPQFPLPDSEFELNHQHPVFKMRAAKQS